MSDGPMTKEIPKPRFDARFCVVCGFKIEKPRLGNLWMFYEKSIEHKDGMYCMDCYRQKARDKQKHAAR